jgi:hypothetical protein
MARFHNILDQIERVTISPMNVFKKDHTGLFTKSLCKELCHVVESKITNLPRITQNSLQMWAGGEIKSDQMADKMRALPTIEYRKIKRPFPPTARAHPVAHPAPPEATSQPFSRPRGRLAARPAQRAAGAGSQAQAAAQADWFKRLGLALQWGCKRLGRLSWDGCNPLASRRRFNAEE